MKTRIVSKTLAKLLALSFIFAYPLTACSDSGKGKETSKVKSTVFKILDKYTPKELGKVKTVVLLDENSEIVYVLSKNGKPAGRGTLGKLIENHEKLVGTKSFNIIETRGSHFVYYCDAGGSCMKIDLPD